MTTLATEFSDSTPLLDRADVLRRRAQEDGFLFFRGLLGHDVTPFLHRARGATTVEAEA